MKLCLPAKVSLYCYLGTITSFSFLLLLSPIQSVYFPILLYLIANVLIKCISTNEYYGFAVRASFLGFVFSLGLYTFQLAPNEYYIFGIYMAVMSFFHFTEFLSIALIQPKELSVRSFLIYHSPEYVIAAVSSWLEFFLEAYLLPDMKIYKVVSYLGLVICISGEFLRKLAMMTANSNFNHIIQYTKADEHVLVTNGIYSMFRHPSYVGWFYWSIGTQIILMNPICLIAYTLASWYYFNDRIRVEEITLLNFFGQQYSDYQQHVGTGLPFINGYIVRGTEFR
ncbi:PREDICTED: protein-S-isoprenylcysteine O-methyltransferase [Nicrophorus vespilloides]|uniref:Protein-S-isoprenylcysteine O-methyltransferase n=1 Tax=Nicrophorus vespilloides TaxID=110193 RepID=A0ABM1NGH6_NICVS|nr:PREDICTED: protein-S-isoprenylcysteine O-methyltransferase [Nicrophorus vespilloides]